MSDKKMIIRNCPASSKDFRLNCQGKAYIDKYKCVYGLLECQDCTDCVLKQIVEKCKKEITAYRNTILPNDGTNTFHFGRQSFAYDILQMLDIEEINPKIKRSECPYGGIDCAWCTEECE